MMQDSPIRGNSNATASRYVLDNAGKEAFSRMTALATAFDPGTMRHLENLGVGPGWHCLEIGGGGGSIAAWLADRVAPTGRVVVTDLNTRFLESLNLPNTEVLRHDIGAEPLPEAAFDLVHARLVLVHVAEREKALERMIRALKPGGWLIDEEFDDSVTPDPVRNPDEVRSLTHVAMMRAMDDRGVDRGFGRRLFGHLRAQGLTSVAAEGRAFMWPAGSPGPALMHANYEQLHDAMIAAGYITEEKFIEDVARLDRPEFLMPSPLLWAAWGQRP